MPSLEAYRRELDYSYATGLFPSLECMTTRPEIARRLLISSKGQDSEGVKKLTALAEERRVRVEIADKVLSRISGKNNCFAAVVFEKQPRALNAAGDHVVLPRAVEDFSAGRFCAGGGRLGYLGDDGKLVPALTVEYHADGKRVFLEKTL